MESCEEEQQSSMTIVREVVIMYYNEKYQLYNVLSINDHVVVESLLHLLKSTLVFCYGTCQIQNV